MQPRDKDKSRMNTIERNLTRQITYRFPEKIFVPVISISGNLKLITSALRNRERGANFAHKSKTNNLFTSYFYFSQFIKHYSMASVVVISLEFFIFIHSVKRTSPKREDQLHFCLTDRTMKKDQSLHSKSLCTISIYFGQEEMNYCLASSTNRKLVCGMLRTPIHNSTGKGIPAYGHGIFK